MASLTAHLLEPGDHGRLGFHPRCPVCRQERLFGALSSEPVVSRRAQAVLAGGVLAVSTAAPAAALAQEPDRQREGLSAPGPPGGELDDPGFDPGGETVLPYEAAPVPMTSPGGGEDDTGEGAPVELEPSEDPDVGLVPLAEEEAPVSGEVAPVPPADAVVAPDGTPVVPGTPPATPEPGLAAPTPPGQTDEPSSGEEPEDRARGQRKTKAKAKRDRTGAGEADSNVSPGHTSEVPAQTVAPPVSPTVAVQEPIAAPQAGVPVADISDEPIGDNRSYVVAPGDSLWSIAKRLLAPNASPARIAREVNRLWSLNEDRIGTGDPDLLMVGTKLELR
jgi:hypothetical protein